MTTAMQPQTFFNLENACLADMASNGIPFPGPLLETKPGKPHRFSIDNKANQPDEFYFCQKWEFKGRPYLKCYYGTWEGGLKEYVYKSYGNSGSEYLSPADYKLFKADEERREKEHQEDKRKEIEKRLTRARNNWKAAQDNPDHEDHKVYLEAKHIDAVGLKYSTDWEGNPVVVVPIYDAERQLMAIQYIQANGEKRIHGLKAGNFHLLGDVKDAGCILFVAEGYATAYSIHKATGCPVVIAFDCGNIDAVISNLHGKYPKKTNPNLKIIIAADDDVETINKKTGELTNPGKNAAAAAAKKHGCTFILPKFPEDFKLPNSHSTDCPHGKRPTDFNDLHVHFGIDEVKNQLCDPEESPTSATAAALANFQCRENQLDSLEIQPASPALPQGKAKNKFHFEHVHSLTQSPMKPYWIIKPYLTEESLGEVFGEPGSMKSFLVIDMGLCIASGTPWYGHPVRKPGPVFYIAGEGHLGMSKRFKAWAQHHNVDLEKVPFFASDRAAQFLDQVSAQEVAYAILQEIENLKALHGNPVLVIIDTLNRNFGAGDENSTEDMTTFVSSVDKYVRLSFKCAVMIVHHTSLQNTTRGRGSSSLHGALEWAYSLSNQTSDKNTKLLHAIKYKDDDQPPDIHLKREIIEINGWKDEGDDTPITSCVLRKIGGGDDTQVQSQARQKGLSPAQQKTLDALVNLRGRQADGLNKVERVPIDDWRQAAYQANISESTTPDAKRKAFKRAVAELVSQNYVEPDETNEYYMVKSGQADMSGTCPVMSGAGQPDRTDMGL